MLITIYNIYIDSLIFIRKNLFVVLPYTFWCVLKLLLQKWFQGDSLPQRFMADIIPLLLISFVEMCIVIIVYKKEEIIITHEAIWKTFNRNSGNVLLLTVFFTFVIFSFVMVLTIIFIDTLWLINMISIPITLTLLATYPLILRHMIFYGVSIVWDSIKAGFKELYKNFFFYFFVTLIGILLSVFPSLFLYSSWLVFPLLPVAERSSLGFGNGINWVRLFFDIVLSTLISIALTYSFILKNKKYKHDS